MLFVKQLTFLALSIIVCFSSTFPCELLTQKEINQQALIIEKKITRDRYIVYGLTALTIANELHQWAPLINRLLFGPLAPVVIAPQEAPQQNTQLSEKLSFLQSCKSHVTSFCSNTAQSCKDGVHFLFCTKEGWAAMMQATVTLGSGIVVSNICNTFIHPDTLRWYVHAHAPYALTITMMKEQIDILHNASEAQQKVNTQQFLHILYDRLVRQSTLMCGYMVYKLKHLEDEEKEVGQRAVRILIAAQNCYLHSIAQQLHAEVVNYQALEKILSKYEEDTNSQVNHFAIIEGETMDERYIVKQRVKRSLQ